MNTRQLLRGIGKAAVISCVVILFQGCPVAPSGNMDYDTGFVSGFMLDEEYWQGYDDSYLTVPDGPILYTGSEIPVLTDGSYDAGYWDGVWYAYNDGYFVCYDYAFTIGFSEGYDLAFRADWFDFIAGDAHPEYLDGSFEDGYNDGFTEGTIFGATDYQLGLPLDWVDAMWDYRDGTDLFIEDLETGTGTYGPVYLYEYGVDPREYLAKSAVMRGTSPIRRNRGEAGESPRKPFAIPANVEKQAETTYNPDEISYRDLTEKVQEELRVAPESSTRADERELTLTDTWLDRVNTYRQSVNQEQEAAETE